MPTLNLVFAWVISVLAGLACIGALAVVIVAEWYALRRTIERHRRPEPPYDPTRLWWRERSAVKVPERRP
jgi:O-antigen ligase